MWVDSTEAQNNLGKYLVLAIKEDIIITQDDMPIAKLSAITDAASGSVLVREQAETFTTSGWRATYEEFLELTKASEDRYEYIEGEIYLLASPKAPHQVAVSELFAIFHHWFHGHKCRPLVAPFDITLRRHPRDVNVVQPDIMVICDLEEKLGDDGYYNGVPALVVEILSAGTHHKDSAIKLNLYMSCGINEYWLVDPAHKDVTVYQFADKKISRQFTYQKHEIAQSYIFEGLTADLSKIF